jgi:hypothetical protein
MDFDLGLDVSENGIPKIPQKVLAYVLSCQGTQDVRINL